MEYVIYNILPAWQLSRLGAWKHSQAIRDNYNTAMVIFCDANNIEGDSGVYTERWSDALCFTASSPWGMKKPCLWFFWAIFEYKCLVLVLVKVVLYYCPLWYLFRFAVNLHLWMEKWGGMADDETVGLNFSLHRPTFCNLAFPIKPKL